MNFMWQVIVSPSLNSFQLKPGSLLTESAVLGVQSPCNPLDNSFYPTDHSHLFRCPLGDSVVIGNNVFAVTSSPRL